MNKLDHGRFPKSWGYPQSSYREPTYPKVEHLQIRLEDVQHLRGLVEPIGKWEYHGGFDEQIWGDIYICVYMCIRVYIYNGI